MKKVRKSFVLCGLCSLLLFIYTPLISQKNTPPQKGIENKSRKQFSYGSLSERLHISEIVASNLSTIEFNGVYYDWFEILNNTPNNIDLASYYLSDLATNLTKFQLSSTPGENVILAGETKIFWASSLPNLGSNHTNFSLSQNGEAVILTAPDGVTIIDQVAFPKQRTDVSYGLDYTGNGVYKYFRPTSPGADNDLNNSYLGILNPVTFSQSGSFYNSPFTLSITNPNPGSDIIYTLDGSNPDSLKVSNPTFFSYKNVYPELPGDPYGPLLTASYESFKYNSGITISDRTFTDTNYVSNFASSYHSFPFYLPTYPVKKANIVRAIAHKPGYLASEIVTNTYIYSSSGQNPYGVPIISTVSSNDNLFDYNTGIYTAGYRLDLWRQFDPMGDANLCAPGNYSLNGSLYERSGNFEYFSGNSRVINEALGFRINGNCSATIQQKALRFYSNTKFNNFSFFSSHPSLKHDRIIARQSGNDFFGTMFKDAFVQNLTKSLNYATQKYQPAVSFLNGEYWGILNMRERYDKYYFKNIYNTPIDSIDLLKIAYYQTDIEEGSDFTYEAFKSSVLTYNMTDSLAFAYSSSFFDASSLIDYQITETFISNQDWPNNNLGVWRKTKSYVESTNNNVNDGRFRWFFYDADWSLGFSGSQPDTQLPSELIEKPGNEIFKKLLTNPDIKENFASKYADVLNSILRPSYSVNIYNQMQNQYRPLIGDQIRRWKGIADSLTWENNCQNIKNYLSNRPTYIWDDLSYYLGLDSTFLLTLITNDFSKGYIKVNTLTLDNNQVGIDPNPSNWTGRYFRNLKIQLTAVPRAGYEFVKWIKNGIDVISPTLEIYENENVTYQAIFQIIGGTPTQIPTPYTLSGCSYKMLSWPSNSTASSYPANMRFVYYSVSDPLLTSTTISGYTTGAYNHTSRTRIMGNGSRGFSFYNVNNTAINNGYPNLKLGGAILGLNTQNIDSASVSFKARTLAANTRKYAIRLQYRIGETGAFLDFSPPVVYQGKTVIDSTSFNNIRIPQSIIGQPYVQLLWKYYYTGTGTSGNRDHLGLDDIEIKSFKSENLNANGQYAIVNYPSNVTIKGTIQNSELYYRASNSILLLPNFSVNSSNIFEAKIQTCANQ
ncbi:MAG: CotH kinase family protein [Leadbetterella sp.]